MIKKKYLTPATLSTVTNRNTGYSHVNDKD